MPCRYSIGSSTCDPRGVAGLVGAEEAGPKTGRGAECWCGDGRGDDEGGEIAWEVKILVSESENDLCL